MSNGFFWFSIVWSRILLKKNSIIALFLWLYNFFFFFQRSSFTEQLQATVSEGDSKSINIRVWLYQYSANHMSLLYTISMTVGKFSKKQFRLEISCKVFIFCFFNAGIKLSFFWYFTTTTKYFQLFWIYGFLHGQFVNSEICLHFVKELALHVNSLL